MSPGPLARRRAYRCTRIETRLVVAALDGLRPHVLSLRAQDAAADTDWLAPALEKLLGALVG